MVIKTIEDVLFPGIDVRLERVAFTADALEVSAAACGPAPRCPGCWARVRRVHSAYERGLAERPLTGRKLQVRLRVRRFFCDRSSCKRNLRRAGPRAERTLSTLQHRHEAVAARGRRRARRPSRGTPLSTAPSVRRPQQAAGTARSARGAGTFAASAGRR
ncbi:transposase family protein [Streptomyces decoyicus]|uniref:transposase family protein n=1 Tax=Streptomyces decoyicus TaxID=249567 RepID=UPI003640D1CA